MSSTLALALLLGIAPQLPLAGGVGGRSEQLAPGRAVADGMDLVEASHGFGTLLPHRVYQADPQGFPTQQLVEIRRADDLLNNVTPSNPVLPVPGWPTSATLPGGGAGNHFVYLEFTQALDVDSVLDPSPGGQANSGLLGSIVVLAVDPATGLGTPVQGRAFLGGKTYAGPALGSPPMLRLQTWVGARDTGDLVALSVGAGTPGLGFPFTEGPGGAATPAGSSKLVSARVFVFVVDSDGDLTTHETFPAGRQIVVRAVESVRSIAGPTLASRAVAAAVVGPDTQPPVFLASVLPGSVPAILPPSGSTNVDPETTVTVAFSEPVQPLSVGSLPTGAAPAPIGAVALSFGPPAATTVVPYSALPTSLLDFTVWELTPAFAFPGSGPSGTCGPFNTVSVDSIPGVLEDLVLNKGPQAVSAFFVTGPGPGLVNVPVAPDAIYVSRTGALPGLSVIDLNGFGQSTGDPSFDFTYQTFPAGNTNFPNNPNLVQYGPTLHPPLFPGACTFDGGSAGVFTLTRDSNLSDLVLRSPLVDSVGDMALGHSLDQLYNNGKDTNGCLAGGGSFCAISGLRLVELAFKSPTSVGPPQPGQPPFASAAAAPNPISFAPHPNPPPIIYPPLCQQPFIGVQEPTSVYSSEGLSLANLLAPGDPFGDPANGIPPSGLLAVQQNAWFVGPDRASLPNPGACLKHQMRQQIGHLLYVVDRARGEVVALNSNRMQVIDRIPLADPTNLAMGPNLDLLAVTNRAAGTVDFIDVDPASAGFHHVVRTAEVGVSPSGIAWDPGNEDVLVCNTGEGTVSVISAFNLAERKRVGGGSLSLPIDVAITQRQSSFGTFRGVYFGWILDASGELWLFESGPSGVSGWGYDDVIGKAPFNLHEPVRIVPDPTSLTGAAWVVHVDPLQPSGSPTGETGGALTRVRIDSTAFGILPLTPGSSPMFRSMTLEVDVSIGPSVLTGVPVDIAFDDQVNLGALPNVTSAFGAGVPLKVNGKSAVKSGPAGIVPARSPSYVFVAVPSSIEGPGVVDVLSVGNGFQRVDTDAYSPGVQSLPAPGVSGLMDYWRQ